MKKILIVFAVIFMMISCPAQVTIDDLTAATTLNTTDLGVYWQGGVTKKLTIANWNTWLNGTTRTIGGTWTFSNAITGSISGNAGTVTNGVYTTGSYSNPAWITSLALSKISTGTSAQIIVANGSGTPTYVSLSGDATIDNEGAITIANDAIGSAQVAANSLTTNDITDGTIADVDISQYAAIDVAKLETGTNAQMIVSVLPGVPSWVTISGDATISNTGAVDLADNLSDDFVFTGKHSYPMTLEDEFNTGSQSLSLTGVSSRFVIIDVGQTSGVIFTDITNGTDGELLTIIASGEAQETFDIDNGTEIALTGNVDLTGLDGWSSVTLIYYATADLWIEVSRSIR